jgi:hypothetical protein
VKECHTKGHQTERGTIIGTGPYESDFTWETFADDWLQLLHDHLSHFHRKVAEQLAYNPNTTELLEVSNVHLSNVYAFYQRLGGAEQFISHTACFCCLREMAEHPLSCGHVLCSACVKEYGIARSSTYSLTSCPLHRNATFQTPWQVYFKPPLAGVRILSLDGYVALLMILDCVAKFLGVVSEG